MLQEAVEDADDREVGLPRREARFETSWLIVIALSDGRVIRATAKDVSLSGARLAIPAEIPLPDAFPFKVVGKDFVVQAKVAWRRGDSVGITVEKTATLPIPVARRTPQAPKQGVSLGSRDLVYRRVG